MTVPSSTKSGTPVKATAQQQRASQASPAPSALPTLCSALCQPLPVQLQECKAALGEQGLLLPALLQAKAGCPGPAVGRRQAGLCKEGGREGISHLVVQVIMLAMGPAELGRITCCWWQQYTDVRVQAGPSPGWHPA